MLPKTIHMLRCAQSSRFNVLAKYASARPIFRAPCLSIFFNSLQREFFSRNVKEMQNEYGKGANSIHRPEEFHSTSLGPTVSAMTSSISGRNPMANCLLPIQEKAIVKHNVLGGKNLIIFAPTSSGKTLVGEIVSVHYAMAKKRALYLVPMKALAEEKYHHFKEMYGELGIKTIISTHDRKEYDQDLERKEFRHCRGRLRKAQCSPRQVTQTCFEGIGLIVIDELQMMGDETPRRGIGTVAHQNTPLALQATASWIVGGAGRWRRSRALAQGRTSGRDPQACGTEKGSSIQRCL